MNATLLSIVICYLIVCPFYLFPSGLPQPADMLIAIGAFILISSTEFRLIMKEPVVKNLFMFFIVVLVINTFHSLHYYALKGIENTIFFASFFYLFNFCFFVLLLFILVKNRNAITLKYAILVSLLIQFGLALFMTNISVRGTIFFNNPNQLGYFVLLMLSVFIVLYDSSKRDRYILPIITLISIYLILYSGSRAALSGVFILIGIVFIREKENMKLPTLIIAFVLVSIIAFVLVQQEFIQAKIDLIIQRQEAKELQNNIPEMLIRGYDRFWIHPEYIFYGAGEGAYDRFNSYHNLEMHSGFGTILFSYGLSGFMLFLSFFFKIIRYNLAYNIILITPIVFYNMTHQGMRTPLFWGVLAAVYMSSFKNKQQDYE